MLAYTTLGPSLTGNLINAVNTLARSKNANLSNISAELGGERLGLGLSNHQTAMLAKPKIFCLNRQVTL